MGRQGRGVVSRWNPGYLAWNNPFFNCASNEHHAQSIHITLPLSLYHAVQHQSPFGTYVISILIHWLNPLISEATSHSQMYKQPETWKENDYRNEVSMHVTGQWIPTSMLVHCYNCSGMINAMLILGLPYTLRIP